MIKDKNDNKLKINDYVKISYMPIEVLRDLPVVDQEKLISLINKPILISDIQIIEDNPLNLELEFNDNENPLWFWINSKDVEKLN